MRVRNMTSDKGNTIANQFIITQDNGDRTFQSYTTTIAKYACGLLILDTNAMNYSRTTSKYLYLFTGLNRKELEKELKSGNVIARDLNEVA